MTRWTRHSIKQVQDIREPLVPSYDWRVEAQSGGGWLDGENLPEPAADKSKDPRTRPPISGVVDGPTNFP